MQFDAPGVNHIVISPYPAELMLIDEFDAVIGDQPAERKLRSVNHETSPVVGRRAYPGEHGVNAVAGSDVAQRHMAAGLGHPVGSPRFYAGT